ncbi:hypothetical protein ACWEQ8_41740 [Streptomyces noursei]
MAKHTVSETNPLYVTGADQYRISLTGIITPESPQFERLQENLKPEHRRPDGYGMAFLESEEHHIAYYGPIQQIQEYRAATNGTAVLDLSQGAQYAFWPHGEGWDDIIPDTTWNKGGEGIVTEFDHPLGGKVVVFEYLKEGVDGEQVPMVGFHCERCHPQPELEHEASMANHGPQDRRWTARNARAHIRSHTTRCRPVDPRWAEVAQQCFNEQEGVNSPTVTWESRCAVEGPCAQIRHLRARA